MTEEEHREILRLGDRDGLEAWIAGQPWVRVFGGWHVIGTRHAWRFALAPGRQGVQVSAFPPDPRVRPPVWVVGA